MNYKVITCGIKAQGSNTRHECGSTCINKTVYLKTCILIFTFLLNYTTENFSELNCMYGNIGGICGRGVPVY